MNSRLPSMTDQALGRPAPAVARPRSRGAVRWIESGSAAHRLLDVLDDCGDALPSPVLLEQAMVDPALGHPRLNWLLCRGLVVRVPAGDLLEGCDMPNVRWLYALAPHWHGRWQALLRPARRPI